MNGFQGFLGFQVSLTNVGTYFPDVFETFEAGVEFAKSKGFEATIHDLDSGGVAGTWSPVSGAARW